VMRRLLIFLCLLLPLSAQALSDLDPLIEGGKLSLNSSILPEQGLVPGQRAALVIEVATNTWFTGGTRIRIPEVPGLVILQTEQFAANTSESRNGQTWVVQRWILDLFPQRAGDFTVGPITLNIQVNGGDLGNVTGEALSPAVQFAVSVPEALAQADSWVAAPRFSVSQQLDRETTALEPGDAFERRIEFRGEDVLAMMLPDFTEDRLPGLAAYPAPPELENSSNRGQSNAQRVQRISYVAEKPGTYVLPAQDYFWWDTREQQLKVLTLDAVEVIVTGDPVAAAPAGERVSRAGILRGAGLLVAVVILVAVLLRWRPWRYLAQLLAPVQAAWRQLASLRRPALPARLNPDSNAGD